MGSLSLLQGLLLASEIHNGGSFLEGKGHFLPPLFLFLEKIKCKEEGGGGEEAARAARSSFVCLTDMLGKKTRKRHSKNQKTE